MKARTQARAIPILILLSAPEEGEVTEVDLLNILGNFRERRRSRLSRTKLLMEAQSRITSIEVIT